MNTTYESEFRWPYQDRYLHIKNLYISIKPTEIVEAFKRLELKRIRKEIATVEEEQQKNDELSKRLEWTSNSRFGRLLDRKLLPLQMTDREEKQMNELIDSDDFNFMPCPYNKADKALEAAVRSISLQTGIEFDELMREVYEQRDTWHQSAIGHAAVNMRNIFEKKMKQKKNNVLGVLRKEEEIFNIC
uniref:Uncharacterized protein n=1 Tax=Ceratitis capitata TaxID=7213 RepID=W8BZ10_CERCA